MKKSIILISLFFCLCTNLYANGVLVNNQKIYPSYINTPQAIEDWLIKAGFKYRKDKTRADSWKPPEKTIKDMAGDCEDLAILACYILNDLGYKNTMIIAIYGENLAHGICWFQEKNDTWSFISTGVTIAGNPKYYWSSKLSNPFDILYDYFSVWETIKLCTPKGYEVYTFYRKEIEKGVVK